MSEHETHIPPSSDPIVGHGGTAYEGNDVHPGVVIWSLAIIAALVAAGFALMIPVQKYFENTHLPGEAASPLAPDRIIPPAPQVQVHPWEDLPEMRAHENEVLAESGHDKLGRMHIPIDAAMNDVLARLKIDPNAPRGITTPGGQGLEYSHLKGASPAAAGPQIQGEIRKNAQ
jgi:hypothetical protein